MGVMRNKTRHEICPDGINLLVKYSYHTGILHPKKRQKISGCYSEISPKVKFAWME